MISNRIEYVKSMDIKIQTKNSCPENSLANMYNEALGKVIFFKALQGDFGEEPKKTMIPILYKENIFNKI